MYLWDAAGWVSGRTGLPPGWSAAVVVAVGVLAGWAAGRAVEWLVTKGLPRLVGRTGTHADDLFIQALRGPSAGFGLVVGFAVALLLVDLPAPLHVFLRRATSVLVVLAVVVVLARLLRGVVKTYGRNARLDPSAQAAVSRVLATLVWLTGLLVVLDMQGVTITPLLTTLGLAGLAIALALQDTLSNFFAGIYVQTDRALMPGHYIKLEEPKIEGFLEKVGWRSTKIRTLPNNMVIVPNAKLASSVITDYDLPEGRMSLLVNVPVGREADTRQVEAVLLEEATKAVREVPGMLAEPAPFIRFLPGVTERGWEFTVICQVKTFVDQYLAHHEMNHRIAARLQAEGIPLSYPTRVHFTEAVEPGRPRPR